MSRRTFITVGVIVGLIALFVMCATIAPYYTTVAVWELRKALPWLGMLTVGIGIFAAFVFAGAILGDRGNSDGPPILLGILGFLIGGAITALWMMHTGYSQDRTYSATVDVSTTSMSALAPRAPYQVGEAQARPNLGDTAGDIAGTTYLPGADRYSTLVKRRGWLTGYEVAFTQNLPLQGRGQADQKCAFDKSNAADRSGGWFSHNLGRAISNEQRYVRFSRDDIYAYCDSGTPYVVVPLKRQVGVWVVTEKPAGVAVYNGKTGDIEFLKDTSTVPGPSYPISLAAKQRESTSALGSFSDWVFRRAGWELPDDDTNSGNDSEFTLSDAGQPVYITPMTGRGSATAISVVSSVPARHSGLQLAPVTVHKLNPVWVSPKAIVDRVKADYQDIPNWQTINVYEVIPTGANSWVATLGTGQNILYRATGTGDLKGDKPTCLQRGDGGMIRCGTLADSGGRGIGTQYGTTTSPAPGDGGDLKALDDKQLADLQRRVAEESACRLTKNC